MARKLEKYDDVVVVQPSSAAIVGAGSGDDIYILSPHVIGAGKAREFAISDSEGKNVLQLVEGLTISSSKVAGEFLALYLSDGSSIMMGGAPDFTFEVGGNILAGVEGEKQNYTTFVTQTLGTTVPAEGAISEGVANIVIGAGTPPPQPTPTPTPTPTPQPDPIPEPAPDPLPGATLINGTEKDDKFDLNTVNWKGTPGKAIIKPVGGNDSIVGLSDVANELIIDGPFDGLTITGGSAGDKVTILEPLTKDMMFTSIDLGGGTDTVVLHKVESMAVLKDAVSKIAGVENLVVNKANLTVSMEGLKELITMSKENLILGEHVKLTIDGTNESDYFDLRDLVWDGAPGEVVINLGGEYSSVDGTFGKLSLLGNPRAENRVDFYASAEDLVFLGGPKKDWISFNNVFEGNLSIDLGEGYDSVSFYKVEDGDLFKDQVANITNVETLMVHWGTPKIAANDFARFPDLWFGREIALTIDGTEQADTIDLTKINDLGYDSSRMIILDNFTSGSDKIVYQHYYYKTMRDKAGKELKGIEGALVDATCDFSANMDAIAKKQAVFNISGTGDVAQGEGTEAEAVLEKIFGNSTSVARTTGYDEIKNARFVFAVDDGQDTFLWGFNDRYNELEGKADVGDLTLLGTIPGVTELAPADIDLA